jgi:Saccharopine dehydrogenase NADP binding domain
MRRVIVVGAGLFGLVIASRLAQRGIAPVVAARSGHDIQLDAEDDGSLRAALRSGDVIVDAAGPFAVRTTRLVRVALERGCDVIDIAESLAWSEAILALGQRASDAGISLYPACSAIAAVAGACIRASGLAAPAEVDLFLAPASAETASAGTTYGLLTSVGGTIRTLRDGRLVLVRGYTEHRSFPLMGPMRPMGPMGGSRRRGGIVEHAGAVLLPQSWPSIRRAEFWVDPNAPLARLGLAAAARIPIFATLARTVAPVIGPGPLARHDGAFAVEIRDSARTESYVFSAARYSYLVAVEPAVIAAEALARGASVQAGVILPHAQIDPEELFARLRGLGIDVAVSKA